jgi:prephenate dehydrogenase
MVRFDRIAIVGVGLIGGSLALAARRQGVFGHITGIGRHTGSLEKAKSLGVIDHYSLDLLEGVKNAQLVVVATPVGVIVPLIEKMLPSLSSGTIITDVGSVKAPILELLDRLPLSGARFVGGHPIAGTENSGVEAAFPDLFKGRKCVLTPSTRTDPAALAAIHDLWNEVGAEVITMDGQTHDFIFGAVSHLPHVLAFGLVNFLNDLKEVEGDLAKYSGGGLKDFTRIAASDPVMWRDIALSNRSNLLTLIDGYLKAIQDLRDLISQEDSPRLLESIQKSRTIRRTLIG